MKRFNLKESQATASKLKEAGKQRVLAILKRMCRVHDRYPSSVVIKDEIKVDLFECHGKKSYGNVFKGQYDGKSIALKAMRMFFPYGAIDWDGGKEKAKRVRLFISLFF